MKGLIIQYGELMWANAIMWANVLFLVGYTSGVS